MADEDKRSCLFVAMDRATRWVYVQLNQEIPQSVLQTKTPMEVLKEWHKKKPELFKKKPRNLAGCDSVL